MTTELAPSFFTTADDGRFEATVATAGPWSPAFQHGGPPSALRVRAAERAAAALPGGAGLVALRAAVDFLGPVPVGPVDVSAHVTRAGRAVVGADAELSAGGRPALRARVWLVRLTEPTGPLLAPDVPVPPGPASAEDSGNLWSFTYADHIEWRPTGGDPVGPGPAQVWARQRIPLLPGEEPSGLQRVACVADSGSGLSSVLDWDDWSFANVDLDLHLLRPLVGEWVHLDAVTRVSGVGSGLCSTTLHDEAGHLGSGAQTLVVQPRPGLP